MVMSWWKLPEDEQPPQEIWGLDDELELWWADVEVRRKEKYGSPDGSGSEPMTTVPMDQNEYAKSLLAGM